MTRGKILTWSLDPGHNSMWNHAPVLHFTVEVLPWVTIQRGIITPGRNSTLNYDPGSEFYIKL